MRKPLLAYLLGIDLLAGALAIVLIARMEFGGQEIAVALLLLGCAVLNIEALHRVGEPAGVFSDLQAVWTLPMAFLLSPIYGLLAPTFLNTIQQFRVNRAVPYRRLFSSAAIGLSNVVVAVLLRLIVGAPSLLEPVSVDGWLENPGRYALAAVVAGAAGPVVNLVIIMLAVKLNAPETPWRELLSDNERTILTVTELCCGIAVTYLVAVNDFLAVVMVPPMLLLQRSVLHGQLNAAARLDGKTGLLNAATWNREAEQRISADRRAGRAAALLLIDLDHFKQVNDTYGHLVGDRVLKALADELAEEVRKSDLAGRFGGEEFVLLLPATPVKEAGQVAARLHRRVAAMSVALEGGVAVSITVSIGVAELGSDGADLMELLAAADTALYRAKSSGRNRTCLASEPG